jgi:c-di-GMP-binding flagellar brake protein YcgR
MFPVSNSFQDAAQLKNVLVMARFEIIEGAKIDTIFDHLIKERTLVKVSLPNSPFENLTLFTGIKEENKQKAFCIDPPEGLIENLRQIKADRLAFEFTGPDQLLHRFEAPPTSRSEKAIWFEYPQSIERHQMRNNFRVKVMTGSYVDLNIDDRHVRMQLDNLSLGGVYCLCQKKFKPLFEIKQRLNHMELSIVLKNGTFVSSIDKVQVIRIETQARPRLMGIAFEFIKIQNDVKKKLVQYIYEMQREFLQARFKTEL